MFVPGKAGGGGSSDINTTANVSVINTNARMTINADDPVVILSAEIELLHPQKLLVSGVINGTFHYVCGLAVYVDGNPINRGTGTNKCHTDCFQIMYGNGNNGYMCPIPFETSTEMLEPGTHDVEIGVIGKWVGTKRPVYINSRSSNDMASSSSLTVRAL